MRRWGEGTGQNKYIFKKGSLQKSDYGRIPIYWKKKFNIFAIKSVTVMQPDTYLQIHNPECYIPNTIQ